MDNGNARKPGLDAQDIESNAMEENLSPSPADDVFDFDDDFDEFGKYARMAAGARFKQPAKSGVQKMRTTHDVKGLRKLGKPEHRDKDNRA